MNLEQEYGIEHETIYILGEFSILWCYFEQREFCAETSPSKMIEWAERQVITSEIIDLCENIKLKVINYLKHIDDQTIETRIYSENRQPSVQQKKLISDFLEVKTDNPLPGCSLFILRIRNNMFHGLKDIYTLNEQREMFIGINSFLKFILK